LSERLDEIRHTLEIPFKFVYKGQEEIAEFITLRPPTTKNRRECGALEQSFMRALPTSEGVVEEQIKSEPVEDSKPPTGTETMAMIAMSKNSDLGETMEIARKLFLSDVAYINGETKVVGNSIDNVSLDDFKELVGKYLVGFILRSAFNSQKTS